MSDEAKVIAGMFTAPLINAGGGVARMVDKPISGAPIRHGTATLGAVAGAPIAG